MKLELHWKIVIGLFAGAVLGYFFSLNNIHGDNPNPSIGFFHLSYITWMGDLFLRLLKMIVIPVIVCSIISGVSHLPIHSLGKIGLVSIIIFKSQMLIAAVIGLCFVNLMQPGKYINLQSILNSGKHHEEVKFITEKSPDITEVLLSMIPSNIFSAFAEGNLIQIILFAIFAGIALVVIKDGNKILDLVGIGLEAILKVTHMIMELAPYGVFALITKTVAIGGLHAITEYGMFMLTVISALLFLLFVVGSIYIHFFTDFSPIEFFIKMREVMLTAFSTSSSAATIPTTLNTMEEKFHIPNQVASFVIPVGATMNMNGAAIYEAIATLFIAQAWLPEPLSLSKQVFVVFMVLIATFGTPGIPHGSLVTLAVVFQAVGLPLEAIGVILSIDRILDMTRTMVNISFDSISCLMINRFIRLNPDNKELVGLSPSNPVPEKISV